MTSVFFLCIVASLMQEFVSGTSGGQNDNCQLVAAAIRSNSCWSVDKTKQMLQWYRQQNKPCQLSPCLCNPLVGGLGNISKIEVTASYGQQSSSEDHGKSGSNDQGKSNSNDQGKSNSRSNGKSNSNSYGKSNSKNQGKSSSEDHGKPSSNSLCSGCAGAAVPVTDYSFSVDDPTNGVGSKTFGPCRGITVYRCSCPTPTTTKPTVTIPTVTIPTVTIPTIPTVTIPTVTIPTIPTVTIPTVRNPTTEGVPYY